MSGAVAAEVCEHFYAWLSPAGASKSARICEFCHWPDPEWLNHVVEIDRGHGDGCVHCWGVNLDAAARPADPDRDGEAS